MLCVQYKSSPGEKKMFSNTSTSREAKYYKSNGMGNKQLWLLQTPALVPPEVSCCIPWDHDDIPHKSRVGNLGLITRYNWRCHSRDVLLSAVVWKQGTSFLLMRVQQQWWSGIRAVPIFLMHTSVVLFTPHPAYPSSTRFHALGFSPANNRPNQLVHTIDRQTKWRNSYTLTSSSFGRIFCSCFFRWGEGGGGVITTASSKFAPVRYKILFSTCCIVFICTELKIVVARDVWWASSTVYVTTYDVIQVGSCSK